MKKKCILLLLTMSFISCESINIDTDNELISPLLQKIQGHFEACGPHPLYAGAYAKVSLNVSGSDAIYQAQTHTNSDCSDVRGPLIITQKINKIELDPLDPTILHIDYKLQKIEFRDDGTSYLAYNFCGMTDWATGVAKEITGMHCPTFLGADSHHSSFKNAGDFDYSSIKLVSPTKIQVIAGYTESGDSPAERKVSASDMIEITKQ